MNGDPVLFQQFHYFIDWQGTGLFALAVAVFLFFVWLGKRSSRTTNHPPKP